MQTREAVTIAGRELQRINNFCRCRASINSARQRRLCNDDSVRRATLRTDSELTSERLTISNVRAQYMIEMNHATPATFLQSVQNAAARLVTGARRCDHITPVLRQLHWLPVRQRVAFKVAGLVHQSLAGAAPVYLTDDCHLLSDAGRRPLRSHSNDIRKLLVPRTHNKLGDRSFSAAGPRLWNDLPHGLQRPGLSFDSFRRSLKTHLFGN